MFCIDGNKLNDKQKLVLLNTTHCFWIWQNWQNQKTQQNGTKSEPSIHLPSQWKCRRKALPARVSFCASFNLLDPLEACNVINVTWTHFIINSLSIKQSQTLVFFQDTLETSWPLASKTNVHQNLVNRLFNDHLLGTCNLRFAAPWLACSKDTTPFMWSESRSTKRHAAACHKILALRKQCTLMHFVCKNRTC